MKCCVGTRDRTEMLEYNTTIISRRDSDAILPNKDIFLKTLFKNLNKICIRFKLSNIISQFNNNYVTSPYFKKKNSKQERIKNEMKLMQGMLQI